MTEWLNRVHFGDCREILRRMPAGIVQTCVTSPPYWRLRDYGVAGQIGQEATPEEYVAALVEVFRLVWRVLRDDGTAWLNLGDTYAQSGGRGQGGATADTSVRQGRSNLTAQCKPAPQKPPAGYKPKDLIGIPWLVAFALRADGWYLRQEIIWNKRNPTPESVEDRCTRSHEQIFLLSKSERYYFDWEAIKEPAVEPAGPGNKRANQALPGERTSGENANLRGSLHKIGPREWRRKRDVWTVSGSKYRDAHFATFPADLIEPCILAGAPAGAVVLDPFVGSGTTGQVSERLGRAWIGCELNPANEPLQRGRLTGQTLGLELA